MEVISLFVGENFLESKMLYFPAEDGKAAFMAKKDMAILAAEILTGSGHENKIYHVSGEQSYSFYDIATLISKIIGQKIKYISPPAEEFKATLKSYGVSDSAINMTLIFAKGIADGEFDETSTTYKDITGNRTTPLSTFLNNLYA